MVAFDGLILPSALPDFFATVLWVDSNFVVPILLPLFSLWSDAGLRDSSALIRQARLVYDETVRINGKYDETCPGVPPVILRQHYNLSVLALAFIM